MADLPVLVLNSGSSSIKFSVYEAAPEIPEKLKEGAAEGIGSGSPAFWTKGDSRRGRAYASLALPDLAPRPPDAVIHATRSPRPGGV